ncbi:MAG: hypothetical protein JWL63_2057 [Rhodocyclales bacterium]|nr:hypothetical protein [Rhodocyclales bacterium]
MEKNTKSQRSSAKGDEISQGGHHQPAKPSAMNPGMLLSGILLTVAVLAATSVLALRQAPHADMSRAVGAWDFGNPGWWAWPLERNAFKRHVVRGNLRDVTSIASGRLLWAVGESGLILNSRDGGETWAQQHPALPTRPAALSFNLIGSAQAMEPPDKQNQPPASNAVQMVQQQTVLKGLNRQQPAEQAANQKAELPAAPVQDRRNSVVQSKLPPVVKAPANQPNARPLLPPQADPQRATLNSVYFSDARRGWAAGTAGALLVTTDGGASWRAQPTGTTKDIASVIFANDARRGWLVLADNHMRITTDGGQTWREQPTFDDRPILEEMLSATGRSELRLVSSDSHGLVRDAGNEIWVMGTNTLLVVRGPQGVVSTVGQWTGFVPAALQITADGQRIVMAGSGGAVRLSTDGGKSWKAIDSGKHGDIRGLTCDAGITRCIAVGDSGSILLANDLLAQPDDWRSLTAGAGATIIWARFKDKDGDTTPGEEGEAVTGANQQLATHDGGMTWDVLGQSKVAATVTRSSNLFVDGALQWRVGPLGKAERSDDGGKSWRRIPTGSDNWFWSVFFMRDHQRGWIAGSDGEILVTRDGGTTWQTQTTPTRNWLWHVSMAPDGKHGRALGGYGTVLLTDDGGVHWRESAPYSRWPAPWYWLLLVIGGTLLTVLMPRYLRSRNREPDEVPDGAAASLNSDQPITHLQDDRLGYRPAVEALANFLRNAATEPRITIAISGPWGSGKSSMMRMLQTEMVEKGYRTVWFNAWHHQQEGRQLTALFNAIRRQGVPSFMRLPFAALRVRSRLIWGRSAFYKVVCIAIPLTMLVALGDFSRQPDRLERFKGWLAHTTLQWDRTVVTDKTIEKLKPVLAKAPAAQSSPAATPAATPPAEASVASATPDNVSREYVRPAVLDYMRNALVWESAQDRGQKRHCGDKRPVAEDARCVFKQPEQLLVTIEKGTGLTLWPSEREAILKASEQVPVLPLFPALEHFLVPLAGLLALLFTKGITVYGMEMLKPLRGLLGASQAAESSKEPTGSIEHYRREYCMLTEALDGRLLVFIDDIDRCNAETVNGIMELTNYMVDVGRCFVVLGMAMDRVKACIRPQDMKVDGGNENDYADQYLRKLVHIELPVPLANAKESLALFVQQASVALKGEQAKIEERRRWFAQLWAIVYPWLRRLVILVLLVTAISLAITAGRVLNNYRQPPALNIRPVETVAPAATVAVSAQADASTPTVTIPQAASMPSQGGDVGIEVPAPTRMPWTLAGVLGGLLFFGLAIGSSRVLQERVTLALGGAMRTRDSDSFRLALQTWIDAVRMHDDTPRGIKRFCNRARLFSLYEKQDAEALHREGLGVVATPDVHIVALAAIHHVAPEVLLALAEARADGASEKVFAGTDAKLVGLRRCAEAHRHRFGWPDVAAIQRFLERVERIAVR